MKTKHHSEFFNRTARYYAVAAAFGAMFLVGCSGMESGEQAARPPASQSAALGVGVWRGTLHDQVKGMGQYGKFDYLITLTVRDDLTASIAYPIASEGWPAGVRSGRTLTWRYSGSPNGQS